MLSITACKNNEEAAAVDKSSPKYGFGEKTSGALSFIERNPNDFVTALGITVPKDTRWSFGDFIPLLDVMDLDGLWITQDGSWEWIDADETTPQRGDIVVYTTTELGGFPSHCSVCVYSYDGSRYMNVDGNYGDEPGGVKRGYSAAEEPNKMWPDSYAVAPGTEVGIGVWRSTVDGYAETLAEASEQMLEEYKAMDQYDWLEAWIPEIVYGAWCYYTVPIAINLVYENEHGIESRTAVGKYTKSDSDDEEDVTEEETTTHPEVRFSHDELNYEGSFNTEYATESSDETTSEDVDSDNYSDDTGDEYSDDY